MEKITKSEMVQAHCVILKINQKTVDSKGGDVYKAARYAWNVGRERVEELNATPNGLILAVVDGVVKGVYTNAKWKKVTEYTDEKDKDRYEFDAVEADQATKDKFMEKHIDDYYRRPGMANSKVYTWEQA
ncbi:MAG: hypothetical protein IJ859_06820 [Synergistaceae bacterium]|nr:hypothetical protein [Synergistaceae bacterium]